MAAEFDRKTLRTLSRDSFSTRAISRVAMPFSCSSRIAVRCDWLNIFGSLSGGDLFGDAVQLLAHAFDLAQHLSPLLVVHLRYGFPHPASGPEQNGRRRRQFLRQRRGLRGRRRRPLPLRLEK
jgi:hypothetical protein